MLLYSFYVWMCLLLTEPPYENPNITNYYHWIAVEWCIDGNPDPICVDDIATIDQNAPEKLIINWITYRKQ